MPSSRPDASPEAVRGVLRRAWAAIECAREVRLKHRKRSLPGRGPDLAGAILGLRASMSEMRPLLHAIQHRPIPFEAFLRDASQDIQAERRRLLRMMEVGLRDSVIALEGVWGEIDDELERAA